MRGGLTLLLIFGVWFFAEGQDYWVSGYVSDKESGEKLSLANILDITSGKGTISDSVGFFRLKTPQNKLNLQISYVGYHPFKNQYNVNKNSTINIGLIKNTALEEIDVVADGIRSELDNAQMSRFTLPLKKIYLLPSFLGETDIIKSFQLTPGVQSGNEGSLGFYVRGGGPDQNLVIMDGIPLYSINHIFGLYSVFNTDAVSSVSLYKGGFPARYGGRLSSVLDIRLKNGNLYEYHGNISAGLIFSKFNLEGPIKKGKIGFNLSARRTYADLFYKVLQKTDEPPMNNGLVYFYDINSKINIKLSGESHIYLNSFLATDDASATIQNNFSLNNKEWEEYNKIKMNWKNLAFSLKWSYSLSDRFSVSTMFSYSNYNFDIAHNYYLEDDKKSQANKFNFDYISGINELISSVDFNLLASKNHSLEFGFNATKQINNPGVKATEMVENNIVGEDNSSERKIQALKGYIYFEDEWAISRKIKTNIGIHISGYWVEQINYAGFEPRISFSYMPSARLTFKTSWVTMNQYIHLLSTATIRSPIDLWVPTTKKVKPERSSQFALGTVYDFGKGIEFNAEAFYKTMHGVLEYKDGATFLGSTRSWEDKIEAGEGWSYGTEFLIRKAIGKTTGWIGYTLSWSNRQYKNVNFGNPFPYRYDSRHDLSLVFAHKLSDNVDAGMTWVYSSGNAVTLHTQRILTKNIPLSLTDQGEINYFDSRNNYRMPAYHRLDASINFHKKKKHGVRTWQFGLYNAYSQQNPFFLFFGYDNANKEKVVSPDGEIYYNSKKVLKQFSLLPILPSISYSYKF